MRQTRPQLFPLDLHIPLRDALRGVASFADATEEALEPAARLLPDPIRSRFRQALHSIEATGKRLISAPLDADEVRTAADFVSGLATGRRDAATSATVIGYAWEHLNETLVHRQLISETILAAALSRHRPAPGSPAEESAAAVLALVRGSSAIGRMPGLVTGGAPEAQMETDLALVAVIVWLLSARTDTMAEEEKLLDLAAALVTATREDVLDAMQDERRLPALLRSAADHL